MIIIVPNNVRAYSTVEILEVIHGRVLFGPCFTNQKFIINSASISNWMNKQLLQFKYQMLFRLIRYITLWPSTKLHRNMVWPCFKLTLKIVIWYFFYSFWEAIVPGISSKVWPSNMDLSLFVISVKGNEVLLESSSYWNSSINLSIMSLTFFFPFLSPVLYHSSNTHMLPYLSPLQIGAISYMMW